MTVLEIAAEIGKLLPSLLASATGAAAAVVACIKLRRNSLDWESRRLKERHERLAALFESGGLEQAHPALIEAAVASAVGSRGISALTIRFLWRPANPAPLEAVDQFMKGRTYLDVDRYDGRIGLKSDAENYRAALGVVAVVVGGVGMMFLFYELPQRAMTSDWLTSVYSALLGSLLATAAVFFIREATRVAAAISLTENIVKDDQHAAASAQTEAPPQT